MKTRRTKTISQVLSIVLFSILLPLPLIGTFFHWDFYPYQGENRRLAELPNVKTLPASDLPQAVDAYVNDHFGFRNTFIRRYTRLKKKIFHTSPNEVVCGADDWMFMDITIKDYMGFRPFEDSTVQTLCDILKSRKEQTALAGIPYLLAIAPDKIKVYADKKPNLDPQEDTICRLKQLQSALPRSYDANLLYLLPALTKEKEKSTVYWCNDTHWNDYGAYTGYREIIKKMQQWDPSLKPLSLNNFTQTTTHHTGDLIALNGGGKDTSATEMTWNGAPIAVCDYPVGPEQTWHTWPKNVPPPQLYSSTQGHGRLLVLHDSFGVGLMKFLPHNFEQTAFFWIYSSPEALDALIRDFRPDLILEVHVERRMHLFLNHRKQTESN